MGSGDLLMGVEVRVENLLGALPGATDDPAVGPADKGLAGELQPLFPAHAITQPDEVSVLKRCDAHLGFVQTVRPLADGAGLRNENELCTAEGQCAHVFWKVPVVANGHSQLARPVE